jgi:pimeloyl-ACP methyl ester carboxylesterase
MQTVTSNDGTRIGFWKSGSGPPLLLIHGAVADHTTTWRSVLSKLGAHFTVYAMDRRGRGGSGDHPVYALEREAEDVLAVVEAVGADVSVLGHSHGALCALEAARHTDRLARLVLYEGVPLRGSDDFRPGVIDRLEAKLAAGDVEGVLMSLLCDVAEMPAKDVEQLREQPEAWAVRLGNARTVPRELRAYERYSFAAERFTSMRSPTLLLVGGQSPARELENARAIAAALRDARVAVLEGEQHTAMHSAPDAFVDEVARFLRPVS